VTSFAFKLAAYLVADSVRLLSDGIACLSRLKGDGF
jgi:hypothetical protein